MSANKTLDGRSFGQKLMSGAFIYTLISIVLGFGVGAVALLAAGNADGPGDIAVFARAEDVGRDMGRFMREALAPLGGRGGGRPGFAQGGAPVAIPIAELAGRLNGGEGA